MLGAGLVVYGDGADMMDQALNATEFFRNESCGKCVPCRLGSQKLVEIGTDIQQRPIRRASSLEPVEAMVGDLQQAMEMTSICGLGMVAGNPLISVFRHFRDDLASYVRTAPARPSANGPPSGGTDTTSDRESPMSIGLTPELARREDDEGIFARDVDGHLIRMDKVTAADLDVDITIKIDGRPITVKKAVPATDSQGKNLTDEQGRAIPRATTIYDAACKAFTTGTVFRPADAVENPIPILCHREHMDPVAVCRLCVVEIAKVKRGKKQTERKLLPACQHRVEETMEVQTVESPNDPKARARIRPAVTTLTELLMADHPTPCPKEKQTADCELEALAKQFEVGEPRFSHREPRPKDDSSLVIAVDHDACIMCDRCVRGCNDIRDNQVIGRSKKGYQAQIAFDLGDPMGNSSCVACGECMISCPTGALTHKSVVEADPWAKDVPAARAGRRRGPHPPPAARRPPRLRGRRARRSCAGTRGRSSAATSRRGRSSAARGRSARPRS